MVSDFQKEKQDVVIIAATKVGGILANSSYTGEFVYDNLTIALNTIHQADKEGVNQLLFQKGDHFNVITFYFSL